MQKERYGYVSEYKFSEELDELKGRIEKEFGIEIKAGSLNGPAQIWFIPKNVTSALEVELFEYGNPNVVLGNVSMLPGSQEDGSFNLENDMRYSVRIYRVDKKAESVHLKITEQKTSHEFADDMGMISKAGDIFIETDPDKNEYDRHYVRRVMRGDDRRVFQVGDEVGFSNGGTEDVMHIEKFQVYEDGEVFVYFLENPGIGNIRGETLREASSVKKSDARIAEDMGFKPIDGDFVEVDEGRTDKYGSQYINRVMRKSDKTIFEIGDEVDFSVGLDKGKKFEGVAHISEFWVDNGKIFVHFSEHPNTAIVRMHHIEKRAVPASEISDTEIGHHTDSPTEGAESGKTGQQQEQPRQPDRFGEEYKKLNTEQAAMVLYDVMVHRLQYFLDGMGF